MNIKDFKASLPYLVEAELTPFIWGVAGIGKSSVVKQYAEERGFYFFPFYLGTQSDLGDILGLQEFIDNGDGTKSTAFAIPKWLHDAINYCEENPKSGAVIFLDEFNRARRDILNGMFSLALDKTFHTVKLPKNCHVIAAGNPPTDEYFTTDINETALMARFVHVKLEPSVSEWIDYAKNREIETSIVEFIRHQPDLLEQKGTDFQLPVKPDRRSYERLNKLFRLKTPSHLLEQLMHGIIGLERTVAYLQFMKEQDKPLTALEVLTGQKSHLIQKWSNPVDVQAACLNLTCDSLKEELDKRIAVKGVLNSDEKKHLMSFLVAIPKDIAYVLMAPIIKGRGELSRDFHLDPLYEKMMLDLITTARGTVKENTK